MPALDPALLFIVEILFDAGPVSASSMGASPLSWQEIQAWQRCAGVSLHPWQSRLIRKLSSEYLAESQTADAHDAPPPWARETQADQRAAIAKHIRNVIRG